MLTPQEVMNAYQIYKIPVIYQIDPEGIIVAYDEGEMPEAKIKGMMESIKPK